MPGTKLNDIEIYENGWENTVISVSNEIIFRFPHRELKYERLDQLKKLTDIVSKRASCKIPSLHIGKPLSNCCTYFIYYNKIHGINYKKGHVGREKFKSIGDSFVSFLKSIRIINVADIDGMSIDCPDEKALKKKYEEFLRHFEEISSDYLEKDLLADLEEKFMNFSNMDIEGYRPVLCHCDISDGNVLFDGDSGRISGIIDWDYSSVCDGALDIAGILYYFGYDVFKRVYSAFEGSDDMTLIDRVYFYASVAGMYKIIYGIENQHPEFINSGANDLKIDLRKFHLR
ncbi:MAG: aminoglycoside phosphotransferase family protein [Thermoplasmata archaeon]